MNIEALLPIVNLLTDDDKCRLSEIINGSVNKPVRNQELIGWSEKEVRTKLLKTIFKTRREG